LLYHDIIVIINNYNYVMVKQNFRINSESFVSPKHYPKFSPDMGFQQIIMEGEAQVNVKALKLRR
jgi:hypothetical protein